MAINHTWLVKPMISYCRFNITNSMVFDNVTQVCNCILELEAQYVKWPNQDEMAIEENTFFSRYGVYQMLVLIFQS